MSALYERSQLTQVMISSAPATAETMDKAEYLRLDCTIKEVQFTAGQKQDIDVTTLCSTEQENINGLGASSEISMSGNFYLNQAQNALREPMTMTRCMRLRCSFRPVRALSSWRKCVSTPGHPVPTAWWLQRFHFA